MPRWRSPLEPASGRSSISPDHLQPRDARKGRRSKPSASTNSRAIPRSANSSTPPGSAATASMAFVGMSASRDEPPLPANGCTRARSLSNSLISRNSRSARSAPASSKGRSCRHCSDHRKSQAGRNSASRHRTRNNLGLDRYTKGAGCGAPCAIPKLSGRKLEGCYSVADDSPAGSRNRASVTLAVYEPAQPARRPAAAIGR
jgi:hypothetical protein